MASACGTSPKAPPRTHTPPHNPTNVGAPTLAEPTSTPRAQRPTQHYTPDPRAINAAN